MKFLLLLFTLLEATCLTVFSQDVQKVILPDYVHRTIDSQLVATFREADTVLLVSHIATGDAVNPETHKRELRSLLVAGRPNSELIKEQKIITGAALDTLINNLKAFSNGVVNMAMCHFPQQAIILLKNGQGSYIDLCFHCLNFGVAGDVRFLEGTTFSNWAALKQFFISQGFKYNMKS